MSTSSPSSPSPSAAAEEANAAIRAFVAGRGVWTPADLAELARLRRAWMDAVRAGMSEAA